MKILNSVRIFRAFLTLLAMSLILGPISPAEAASVDRPEIAGTWEVSWTKLGDTNVDCMQLDLSGETISGKGFHGLDLKGIQKADTMEISLIGENKTKPEAILTGRLQDGELSGTMKADDDQYQWTARRPASRPPNAPRTQEFAASQFHRYFSGTIAPVLKLWPGDTLHTETVDAGGFDKKGVRRSRGGNPLTGPFYVEGALAGDTLVVRLKRIRLNRDTARSGS